MKKGKSLKWLSDLSGAPEQEAGPFGGAVRGNSQSLPPHVSNTIIIKRPAQLHASLGHISNLQDVHVQMFIAQGNIYGHGLPESFAAAILSHRRSA